MRRVDVDGAQELIAAGALVLDVLPASIYEQEHLPGAQSMPLESLDRHAVAGMSKTHKLLVYCFDQH